MIVTVRNWHDKRRVGTTVCRIHKRLAFIVFPVHTVAFCLEVGPPFISRFAVILARPIQALGLEFGNCGPSLDWYCETVDTGGAYLEEANYVGVAMDRLGLPTVAYYERNTYPYPSISNLKVAYQQPFTIYLPLILRDA